MFEYGKPLNGACDIFKLSHQWGSPQFLHIGGQSFWHLLSGDRNLYVDIIEPLGHEAQRYAEEFKGHIANLTNRLTREFTEKYCHPDGAIDWPRLVQAVSGNMNQKKNRAGSCS